MSLGYTIPEDWAITISPNPKRPIIKEMCYGALPYTQQINSIMHALNATLIWCKHNEQAPIHFELNKKLMVHCHFTLKHMTATDIQEFQTVINCRLGNSRLTPNICCNVCRIKEWYSRDPEQWETWDAYCKKDNWITRLTTCKCTLCKMKKEAIREDYNHADASPPQCGECGVSGHRLEFD